MHCEAFTRNGNMSIAIKDAAQLAYPIAESLVTALVLILRACRDAHKHNVFNLLTAYLDKVCSRHLCHFLKSVVTCILESPYQLACFHCILTNVANPYGKILQEEIHTLAKLFFDTLVYYLCHSLGIFISLFSEPFGLSEGYFSATQRSWKALRQIGREKYTLYGTYRGRFFGSIHRCPI